MRGHLANSNMQGVAHVELIVIVVCSQSLLLAMKGYHHSATSAVKQHSCQNK